MTICGHQAYVLYSLFNFAVYNVLRKKRKRSVGPIYGRHVCLSVTGQCCIEMAARDGVIFAFVFPRPMLRYVSALSQPDFYILVLYLDHSIERRRFFSRRVNRVSDKSRSPWAHLTSV